MDALKAGFLKVNPTGYYLEPNKNRLEAYLFQRGLLETGDSISNLEKPGPGNMNVVFRVIPTKATSFIVKQARPWVEKYPSIPAPINRIQVENLYYQHVSTHSSIARLSPKILDFDRENALLVMEDLGDSVDYSYVYQSNQIFNRQDLDAAIVYLNQLKKIPRAVYYPDNLVLRKLNHQHIFELPFIKNTFELDNIQAGLGLLSNRCKNDPDLIKKVNQLGNYYLGKGNFLVHGDFYPGSLLNTSVGLKVIDPEFSFMGPEEWDIAVFIAHLFLSSTPQQLISAACSTYQKFDGFSQEKFAGFVGTEIIRRLLGLAQVPVDLTLGEKKQLIDRAINWIKSGKIHTLSGYEHN